MGDGGKEKQAPNQEGDKPVQGLAITALVTGIVSLFIFPFIFGVVAVVTGAIAYSRARKNSTSEGTGLALAGLIMGIIGLVGGLILFATLD